MKVRNFKFKEGSKRSAFGVTITLFRGFGHYCSFDVEGAGVTVQGLQLTKGTPVKSDEFELTLEIKAIACGYVFLEATFHGVEDNTLKARRERALLEVEELKEKNKFLEEYYENMESVLDSDSTLSKNFRKAEEKLRKSLEKEENKKKSGKGSVKKARKNKNKKRKHSEEKNKEYNDSSQNTVPAMNLSDS